MYFLKSDTSKGLSTEQLYGFPLGGPRHPGNWWQEAGKQSSFSGPLGSVLSLGLSSPFV